MRRWFSLQANVGASIVLLLPLIAAAQIPANGDFELGLTGWTASGTGNSAALTRADFTPPLDAIDWPDRFGVLSTGPGNVPGGAATDIDGAGGNNEFDTSVLSIPIVFDGSPSVLRFDWAFASSEEDQPAQFDDVLTVEIDADGDLSTTGDRTRLLARSSFKPGGSSPFADGPQNGSAGVVISNGASPPLNSNLRFGVHEKQAFCAGIPGTVEGTNAMAIVFSIADQGDSSFDSALLVDNVAVEGACSSNLEQLTVTPAEVLVEAKDGQFIATPIINTRLATDDDGSAIAFISSSNLTGDNPSAVEQVFVLDQSTFERVSVLGMNITGLIHSVSISGNGRYLAISAAPSDADNLEIYRFDRTTQNLIQVTDTGNCENTRPAIDDNGSRIAFESTCDSLTGAGATQKIVLRNGAGNLIAIQGAGACFGSSPSVSRVNNARYVAFESDCNHTGGNSDGNREIFRYDRNGSGSFTQITNTAGADNTGVKLAGSNNGQVMVFISSADLVGSNADNSLEVFRFDNGAVTQLTDESTAAYLTAHIDTGGEHFALSRLNPLTGSIQVEYLSLTAPAQVVAEGGSLGAAWVAISGSNAVLLFDAADDFLGANADGNFELWRAVVAP